MLARLHAGVVLVAPIVLPSCWWCCVPAACSSQRVARLHASDNPSYFIVSRTVSIDGQRRLANKQSSIHTANRHLVDRGDDSRIVGAAGSLLFNGGHGRRVRNKWQRGSDVTVARHARLGDLTPWAQDWTAGSLGLHFGGNEHVTMVSLLAWQLERIVVAGRCMATHGFQTAHTMAVKMARIGSQSLSHRQVRNRVLAGGQISLSIGRTG